LLISSLSGTASLAQFAGDWINVDPNTGGITTLSIDVAGTSVEVHAWGKCHPTDCDWGTVPAFAFASDVSMDLASQAQALMAIYDSGFSETTVFVTPEGDGLFVQSYTRFKDNSGRSNYASSDVFQKSASISAAGMIAEVQPLQKFNKLEVLPIMRKIGDS
jgi:hypothetical protein